MCILARELANQPTKGGKMIRINNIKANLDVDAAGLKEIVSMKTGLEPERIKSLKIAKKSVDARNKSNVQFVYALDMEVFGDEDYIVSILAWKDIVQIKETASLSFAPKTFAGGLRPVVAGTGPAGMFAGLALAEAGLRPILLERGKAVSERRKDVEFFWQTGHLNPESNVQFGEGGAGTFSDGKLNTLVKDPYGRNHEVLKRFVAAGAPEEIIYQQKPHLGTDVLVGIVEKMRHEIEEMGGKFCFRSKVTDLIFENNTLKEIEINNDKRIPAQICVLAPGHSARDTFEMLQKRGVYMEPKSFAVGLRIEHPQEMINMDLYGEPENELLGAASYKVTHKCANGRGVYSFCMCPGGYVVNASSEPGRLAVNGMSYQARDSRNANSAMIVSVTPEDFPDKGVLGGVEFQRDLEKKAWELGEGKIPVQLFGDFCKNQASEALGEVTPCMKGEYILTNVRSVLPKAVGDSIEEGVRAFGKRISGFDREDALLSGIESRTSSPVRIVRDQELTANMAGIYPCGEGAGYAGGITSAAMDGIKVAETVCRKYAAIKNN